MDMIQTKITFTETMATTRDYDRICLNHPDSCTMCKPEIFHDIQNTLQVTATNIIRAQGFHFRVKIITFSSTYCYRFAIQTSIERAHRLRTEGGRATRPECRSPASEGRVLLLPCTAAERRRCWRVGKV